MLPSEFFAALKGVTDPEQKRKIVGEKFIRIFEREAKKIGASFWCRDVVKFLVQGTIYPDVVESAAPDRNKAARIKSHHNVGGLPEDMEMSLVEPLRYLFKDEVRAVGEALGLPESMVWRQPFPGPGLTVRCLGEVTPERVACLAPGGRHLHRGTGRCRAAWERSRHQPGVCCPAAGPLGGCDGRRTHLPGGLRHPGGGYR